jgi:hypothetical protein
MIQAVRSWFRNALSTRKTASGNTNKNPEIIQLEKVYREANKPDGVVIVHLRPFDLP